MMPKIIYKDHSKLMFIIKINTSWKLKEVRSSFVTQYLCSEQ